MISLNLKKLPQQDIQNYLQHAIAPRPICFASTIDAAGSVNLSPFSFFNLFSYNPPIVIFSPVRRSRNNTTKHTLENVIQVPEVVINIVTYNMVQQMSLSSCEYKKGTDEFIKAGFTKEASQLIRPPRVKESPVQLECIVTEVKPLGKDGGAGNLIIAEVLMIHIDEHAMDDEGKIDQRKLDLVARLGSNWYSHANAATIFEVEKPNTNVGIGIDSLPVDIRLSQTLTGNNLAQLANVAAMPTVDPAFEDDTLKNIIQYYSINPAEMENELHHYAKKLLDSSKVQEAWQVLLALN